MCSGIGIDMDSANAVSGGVGREHEARNEVKKGQWQETRAL